jgi:hypothetical protein
MPDKTLPSSTSCMCMSPLPRAPFDASSLTPTPARTCRYHPIGRHCSALCAPERTRCKGQKDLLDTTSPRCHPLNARPDYNTCSPTSRHSSARPNHASVTSTGSEARPLVQIPLPPPPPMPTAIIFTGKLTAMLPCSSPSVARHRPPPSPPILLHA